MASGTSQLISVHPEELQFQFELEKQSFCDLKVANSTENHVAFKVKTTSPKKYFVRPNTGVIQPWDSCIIRVTLQAQKEYPPDMQCKDKFLFQSTKVPSNTDVDELPPDTFNKEDGKVIEDLKLRVVYVSLNSGEDTAKRNTDASMMRRSTSTNDNQSLHRLKDDRDLAIKQAQQLQQELETLKRNRSRKKGGGFSISFAFVVLLIGIMVGFLFKLLFSSPAPAAAE